MVTPIPPEADGGPAGRWLVNAAGGVDLVSEAKFGDCTVEVLSDSAYVVNAHRKGWIERWQRNGWKTAARKPVENQDLWRELLAFRAIREARLMRARVDFAYN